MEGVLDDDFKATIETVEDRDYLAPNNVRVREFSTVKAFVNACLAEGIRTVREHKAILREENRLPQVLGGAQMVHPTFTYTVGRYALNEPNGEPDVFEVWRFSRTVRKAGVAQEVIRWIDYLAATGVVIVPGVYDPLMYVISNPDDIFGQPMQMDHQPPSGLMLN